MGFALMNLVRVVVNKRDIIEEHVKRLEKKERKELKRREQSRADSSLPLLRHVDVQCVRWQGRGAKLARVWPASDETPPACVLGVHFVASIIWRSSFLRSEISSRRRAATSNCSSAAAVLHLVGELLDQLGEVG